MSAPTPPYSDYERQPLIGNQSKPTEGPPPSYQPDYQQGYQQGYYQPDQGCQPGYQPHYDYQTVQGNVYGATPPQYYPPIIQQQNDTNVVVVQNQPQPVSTTVIHSVGDNYLTMSVILTFCCLFCTGLTSLICTIPAILFSIMARDAEGRGDEAGRRSNACCSLCCNMMVVFWWLLLLVGAAMAIFIPIRTCYYDGIYSETICYYGSLFDRWEDDQ